MKLPQMLDWDKAANRWASMIEPYINQPIVQGRLVENVSLINGTTVVNHLLGRKLVGWFIVGINGAATVYDNQASNQTPQLTLSLTSNASVVATIWVF